MKLTMHGSGYVGLVTAACFAHMGNDVLCVDTDSDRVRRLRCGDVPIRENGLDALLQEARQNGYLRFTDSPEEGVHFSGLQFIAVGTPSNDDGTADLKYVLTAARSIGRHMREPQLVVCKSTVPVGTADRVRNEISHILRKRGNGPDFDVISNPEFLKEGAAVQDFMQPDRIIVGAERADSIALMRALYAPFNRTSNRLMVMPIRDAEFTKYAANAMLASRISLMNEFAAIAEGLGVDIESVRRGIGADPRIGSSFLFPGCGYGGSCFPKDVSALIRTAEETGSAPDILTAVQNTNRKQQRVLADKVLAHFGPGLSGRTFALWGLAFKPGTDDMRAAPSRIIMETLWEAGARIRAFDPAAMDETHRIYGDRPELVLCESAHEALQGADALLVVTEWPAFRSPDFKSMRNSLKYPVVFDGRNLYDPDAARAAGLTLYAIGRPTVHPA